MKPLTIVVAPMSAVGHFNACLGALSRMLQRGHRVIFIVEQAFQGQAAKFGYEEHPMTFDRPNPPAGNARQQKPGELVARALFQAKVLGDFTPEEKVANLASLVHNEQSYAEYTVFNQTIQETIKKYQPDVFYSDFGILLPAIQYSGIPWIWNISMAPTFYIRDDSGQIPPSCSGYETGSHCLEQIRYFNQLRAGLYNSARYNDLIEKLGYSRYPGDAMVPPTYSLAVYAWPDELNYPNIRESDWFNLEVFHTTECDSISLSKLIPKRFIDATLDGRWSGKLIYLSMGSIGSMDVDLMRRLVSVLSTSPHKYIVSKGPRHEELELPVNMYGDRYLPQTRLLPHVDLVITHGGNNTTTEVFAQGKPMLLLPLFADQFDNAQRLHETGLGRRLDPYRFQDQELIEAIDELLYDEELQAKLRKASRRIQSLNRHEELADAIEKLIRERQNDQTVFER